MVDLHFIEVLGDGSNPLLRLLEILLELHNTGARMTIIKMCKSFPYFIGGGGHEYEWNHKFSDRFEDRIQD